MCERERKRKEASCLDHKAGNLAREEEEHAAMAAVASLSAGTHSRGS